MVLKSLKKEDPSKLCFNKDYAMLWKKDLVEDYIYFACY